MISIPYRRVSNRNKPAKSSASRPFRNIIFVCHSGSPHSYLCQEAMDALLGGSGGTVRQGMKVEFANGFKFDFFLSSATGHFSDVNVIGGDILGQAIELSNGPRNLLAHVRVRPYGPRRYRGGNEATFEFFRRRSIVSAHQEAMGKARLKSTPHEKSDCVTAQITETRIEFEIPII